MNRINNIQYYSDSLAYDFDLFLPKEKRSAETEKKIVAMPKKKETARAANSTGVGVLFSRASTIAITVVLLGVLSLNIFLRAEITNTHSAIQESKKLLEDAENEQARLLIELDHRTSYKNLEKQAAELGMQKRSVNQIEYIQTVSGSKAELPGGNDAAENGKP